MRKALLIFSLFAPLLSIDYEPTSLSFSLQILNCSPQSLSTLWLAIRILPSSSGGKYRFGAGGLGFVGVGTRLEGLPFELGGDELVALPMRGVLSRVNFAEIGCEGPIELRVSLHQVSVVEVLGKEAKADSKGSDLHSKTPKGSDPRPKSAPLKELSQDEKSLSTALELLVEAFAWDPEIGRISRSIKRAVLSRKTPSLRVWDDCEGTLFAGFGNVLKVSASDLLKGERVKVLVSAEGGAAVRPGSVRLRRNASKDVEVFVSSRFEAKTLTIRAESVPDGSSESIETFHPIVTESTFRVLFLSEQSGKRAASSLPPHCIPRASASSLSIYYIPGKTSQPLSIRFSHPPTEPRRLVVAGVDTNGGGLVRPGEKVVSFALNATALAPSSALRFSRVFEAAKIDIGVPAARRKLEEKFGRSFQELVEEKRNLEFGDSEATRLIDLVLTTLIPAENAVSVDLIAVTQAPPFKLTCLRLDNQHLPPRLFSLSPPPTLTPVLSSASLFVSANHIFEICIISFPKSLLSTFSHSLPRVFSSFCQKAHQFHLRLHRLGPPRDLLVQTRRANSKKSPYGQTLQLPLSFPSRKGPPRVSLVFLAPLGQKKRILPFVFRHDDPTSLPQPLVIKSRPGETKLQVQRRMTRLLSRERRGEALKKPENSAQASCLGDSGEVGCGEDRQDSGRGRCVEDPRDHIGEHPIERDQCPLKTAMAASLAFSSVSDFFDPFCQRPPQSPREKPLDFAGVHSALAGSSPLGPPAWAGLRSAAGQVKPEVKLALLAGGARWIALRLSLPFEKLAPFLPFSCLVNLDLHDDRHRLLKRVAILLRGPDQSVRISSFAFKQVFKGKIGFCETEEPVEKSWSSLVKDKQLELDLEVKGLEPNSLLNIEAGICVGKKGGVEGCIANLSHIELITHYIIGIVQEAFAWNLEAAIAGFMIVLSLT